MKLRSSIFSFETLTERPRLSRAVLTAVLLLVGLEIAARIGIAEGSIERDYSLHRLTQDYLDELRNRRPELWLLGNSVAGRGIDAGIISRKSPHDAIVLAHGSASAAGSEAMARFYLDRVPFAPREIIFFFSKDDFNRNSQRGVLSTRYQEWAAHGPPLDLDNVLALSGARGAIVDAVQVGVARLLLPFGKPARRTATPVFDGRPIRLDHPQYLDTARDYEMDSDVVARLARLARRRRIALRFVLMPVTDRYVEFHDRLFPSQPYESIRARLAAACRTHRVPFLDHGDPSEEYHLFKDPYHLNEAGRRKVSGFLARELFAARVERVAR